MGAGLGPPSDAQLAAELQATALSVLAPERRVVAIIVPDASAPRAGRLTEVK